MNHVLVLVEGQTEEAFIRDVLSPGLWPHGVALVPTVVATKRLMTGGKFKGGTSSYQRVAFRVRQLLEDSAARLVTTMLDLYRLPNDFPGWKTCPKGSGRGKAEHLEQHFAQDIGSTRFRPYFSVHEFEALLFADLDACVGIFRGDRAVARLQAQRAHRQAPLDRCRGRDGA